MATLSADYIQLSDDYKRIEQAIQYLDTHFQHQPDLKDVAESVGLSEYHFQRLFTRWAGISPKRFLQFLTKESAKEQLKRSSVLDATYSVGLSSPGRLHDLFVSTEAVTPGEFKALGAGLTIQYGFHPTPFGEALAGVTERGICHLSFVQGGRDAAFANFEADWKNGTLVEDPSATEAFIAPIFSIGKRSTPIPIYLNGTNFQIKVWEALINIQQGSLTTYEEIALHIGHPGAMRAVGTAIGHNPIAYLIPCHRVIGKIGEFGKYRWGAVRKKAILGWEASHFELQNQY